MQNDPDNQQTNQPDKPSAVPNESGQLYLDDFVRISDPNSREIILEKRS
jgi:hypothetical protein